MMDMETKQSYENAIEEYKTIIAKLENDEAWDIVGDYRRKLTELIDEYEYLKNDADAFQKYLKHVGKYREEL